MKKIVYLLSFSLICFSVAAQDEGLLTKQARIALSNGVFVGIGPSFTFGKNIGDYSKGLNVEVGYMKRVNRVLSIGPSVSYLSFKYDAKETGSNNAFLNYDDEYFDSNHYMYFIEGVYVDFKGGDMNLISLAANIKLNLIPIMDERKFSFYVYAKPFVTSVTRKEVKGTGYIFNVYDINDDSFYSGDEAVESIVNYNSVTAQAPWEPGNPGWAAIGFDITDDLKKDSRITGGVFVGPGVEFLPTKNISFYLQALVGYTFPVSFVSTEKYKGNDFNNLDKDYPMTENGFPSLNLQFGVSFNF